MIVLITTWGQPVEARGQAASPWVTLERTECYGTCPVFALRLFADGRVEYEGKRFVMHRGLRTTRLGRAGLEKLHRAISKPDIANLDTSPTPAQRDNRGSGESIWQPTPSVISRYVHGASVRVRQSQQCVLLCEINCTRRAFATVTRCPRPISSALTQRECPPTSITTCAGPREERSHRPPASTARSHVASAVRVQHADLARPCRPDRIQSSR